MKDYENPNTPAASAKPEKNKGGRPKKDVTKTPEFKSAVESAVAGVRAEMEASISAQIAAQVALVGGGESGTAATPDGDAIAALTKSLMALVNGNKPRSEQPLSSEELTSRADGRTRLIELLVPVQAMDFDAPGAPEAPHYRVIDKTFLTDFVIEPFVLDPATKALIPKTIHWTGIPNQCMEPINESAQAIFAAYLQAIGGPTNTAFDESISDVRPDSRPMGVTPGGIVVRGLNPSARRTVGALPDGSTTDVMGIRNQNDPRAKKVNVLGTIAAPAVASAEGSTSSKFSGRLS